MLVGGVFMSTVMVSFFFKYLGIKDVFLICIEAEIYVWTGDPTTLCSFSKIQN